jgi:hypothetical protein
MKKIFLQLILPLLIICGAILSIGTSCGSGPSSPPLPVPCDSTSTKFMALYNAYPSANVYSYDAQVYEYTFKSSVDGNICAIGYQGHPNLVSTNAYKIDIIDATSNTVLSTGTYSFTSSNRGYKTFGPTIGINANTPYIVRRTVVNNLGNVANTISNFKQIPSPFVPIVNGTLTITGTKTYDFYSGTPTNVTNNGVLGCIDFVIN